MRAFLISGNVQSQKNVNPYAYIFIFGISFLHFNAVILEFNSVWDRFIKRGNVFDHQKYGFFF